MIRLSTSDELFREAATKQLGARGYGFAVANAVESELLIGGGAGGKLVNVDGDSGLAAGRLITLTEGVMRISAHIETLFDVMLYVVSPGGGHDALRFYSGPSGLALGGAHQAALNAGTGGAASELAAAWAEALARVVATDFTISVDSDFGRHRIGVVDGAPLTGRKSAKPHRSPWDPGWLEAAEVAASATRGKGDGEAAARAILDLRVAWQLAGLAGGDLRELERRFASAAGPLWATAWPWFVASVGAIPADAISLPPLVGHLHHVLPFPPTRKLMDSLGGRDAMWGVMDRAKAVIDRRWAAHPWS